MSGNATAETKLFVTLHYTPEISDFQVLDFVNNPRAPPPLPTCMNFVLNAFASYTMCRSVSLFRK